MAGMCGMATITGYNKLKFDTGICMPIALTQIETIRIAVHRATIVFVSGSGVSTPAKLFFNKT